MSEAASATLSDQKSTAPKPPPCAKWQVFRNILDYVRAMRTAPSIPADEAAEWVALEQEFTTRTDEIHQAA